MPSGSTISILAPGIVSEAPRRWRRRGDFIDFSQHRNPTDNAGRGQDLSHALARAWGLGREDIAEAPLHYLGVTGEDPDGYCLYAYPVYLHPRREQLILMAGPEFEPDDNEIREIEAVLRGHFPSWRIEILPDGAWIVLPDTAPDLRTTSLHIALGEDINRHLPRGDDAMNWHRIMNEIQMLLFDAPFNLEREQTGRPQLNSLWFWGGGSLPDTDEDAPWQRVVSDDPVALGLGRRHAVETARLHGSPAAQGQDHDIAKPGTLWVYTGREKAEQAEAPILSPAQWRRLDKDLRGGRLERVILVQPGYGELKVTGADLRPWWRWR